MFASCTIEEKNLRNTRVFLRPVYAKRLLRGKCIRAIIFVCIVFEMYLKIRKYLYSLKILKHVSLELGVRAPKKEKLYMNHRGLLSRCFGKPLVKRPIKSSGAREIKPSRVCALVWFTLLPSRIRGTWPIYTNL